MRSEVEQALDTMDPFGESEFAMRMQGLFEPGDFVELDGVVGNAYREPTTWQRFWHWLLRRPLPKPDRYTIVRKLGDRNYVLRKLDSY